MKYFVINVQNKRYKKLEKKKQNKREKIFVETNSKATDTIVDCNVYYVNCDIRSVRVCE